MRSLIRRPWSCIGVAVLTLMAGCIGTSSSFAGDYPNRPIRIIVGFTAGGPTDVPVRYIADKLKGELNAPVIVENKPGAASMLAIRDMLSQARDGYTLLSCSYFDPVNTLLYKNAGYKASDIAPISLIGKYDYAIAVPKDSKFKSMKDVIAYARANPGKLNYGHLGVGSSQNLLMKRIEKAAKIDLVGIPYKGAADAIRDIVAGRLDLFAGPPVVVMPQHAGDRLNVIAVTGKQRLPSAPKVPTLMEAGVPIDAYGWIGLCTGAGTPKDVIDLLNRKVVQIVKSSGYKKLMETSGTVPVSSSPGELQSIINDTIKDTGPLIKELNIKLD